MTFWTSQKLIAKQAASNDLILPWCGARVDCNAYTLTIGGEVYISPAKGDEPTPARAIQKLKKKQSFIIPPGQFAFLTTEESIVVPNDAMAFISMKAGLKFRGLVNVSGFHVDPGYRGNLVFSVFNAGPQPVLLRQAQQAFLIWFADLDGVSDNNRSSKEPREGIDPGMLNPMAGEVHSFEGLLAKIKDNDEKFTARVNTLEREQAVLKWSMAIIAGAVATYLIRALLGQ